MATRTLRIGALLLAILACARTSAAQYQVQTWTTENGLPQNVGRSLLQTRDGYLWIATLDGIARFDGVRFTIFNRANTPGIRSNRFNMLYEAADGALWVGTDDAGVTRYFQGVFTTYGVADGLPRNAVGALTGDAEGHLWVLSGETIMSWTGAGFRQSNLDAPALPFRGSQWDSEVFWASDRTRIYRFTRGRVTARPIPAPLQGVALYRFEEDMSGTLWIALTDGRIARVTGQDVRFDRIPDLRADEPELETTYRDASGREWPVAVSRALNRYWRLPAAPDRPVPFSYAREDREGNIWLGTQGQGLFRIRPSRVSMYSRAQGLLGSNIYPVLTDRTGSVWVGAWPSGLSRITNGQVINYTVADGLPSGLITSLAEDQQGRLWVAGYHQRNGGLRIFQDGRFDEVEPSVLPAPAEVHAMLHAHDGTTWLGTSIGLARHQNGVTTMFTTRDGLAGNDVKVLVEDPDGRVWIGSDGGLSAWQSGTVRSWTERDGLPPGVVRALYRDGDGALWIGTYDSGLARFKDGRFSRFTTREGLFDDGVFAILEDRRGYLWMTSNRGIHRASKRELNAIADGIPGRLSSLSLGKGDGMLNAECNGGSWPSATVGPGGSIWFPTQDGVAVIDPETFTGGSRSVPPHIESVLVNRLPVAVDGLVRLVPDQEALEIQYTGLSLVNSERIHFRYRLDGLDHDWVDVGTRRTAYYSHIPPGSYTFTVAAGSDGVWTSEGASIAIRVIPPFYRTSWFAALVIVAAIGAVALAYRRRVAMLDAARSAQEHFARQLIDSQEHERRRIAAELHDSLGQQLIVIKNHALLGSMNGLEGSKGQFDEISNLATQSIDEVRQISYNLRPYHLDKLGLGPSIQAMTARLGASSNIAFTVQVPAMRGVVPKAQEINVYRIVQESLNNIVKHSGASHASIDIASDGTNLVITIADDGKGFDAKAARPATIGSGFGLAGLAERVGMLGGRHAIVSAPGEGTTVTIMLPGTTGQEKGG